MTAREFRAWLKGRGLRTGTAVKVFGVSRTTIKNWAAGRAEVHGSAVKLCAALEEIRRMRVET